MANHEEKQVPKLSDIFDSAWKIHIELESSNDATNSDGYQTKVKEAIKLFEKCTMMVSELSLFSDNEEIEEVPTSSLKYLLLPAFLGDLMLKLTSQDRLSQVQKASVYFKDFLKRCKCYGLTTEDIPNNPSPSSDMSAARPNLMGMAANREMKIKRYREKKEREERLNSLGSPVDITQRDEDVQREYYLLIVKKWISDSLDEYSNVQQEIEILHHMAKMKKISGDAPPSATAPPPTKGRPPPSAQPLKPFILTRDDIQAKVFGAGYPSIPTMTLEDYFQKEIMEGKIQNSSGGQQTLSEREAVEKKEIEKEREIERDDEDALKKARQWDEWRDDHRRGEGNRQNMG